MICPKCQGSMRSYERNGVTVDQCTDCRGLFLDRGELEHLIDAESRFNGGPAAPPAPSYPTPSHPTPSHPTPGYPTPSHPNVPPAGAAPSRSPMADLSTIASMATDYLGKGKKSSSKKGKKSFIDGLFG
ncbi:MAG: zf-TFIIB domain-containing protein [Nakamurella multipartita]